MQIREIKDKSQWENFIMEQKPNTFLHSWNWGELNKSAGEKVFHLGIFNQDELVGIALIIKVNAKRGKFLFCPHGPIIKSQELWNYLFDYLKGLAIKENVDFIRISPLLENASENLKIFQNYGFRDAPIHMMHPEIAWLLDISKSEDEILKGMRKTTRNLIRRAEREGISVSEAQKTEDIENFYKIHIQTVTRHGFVPFSKEYLINELNSFAPDNQISVFFAKHQNIAISSAIIVFYGDSAFYHHGASLASKIPASYLLMWEIIKTAKKRGYKIFNFWGIAPEGKPKHPWAGLSLFKTGFGGYKENYLHAQDLPIKINYWLNYAIETMRKIKRGY